MNAPIDTRELRNAFGCFATGIVVVTTLDSDGHAIAKTANSFASVSLDPPLVLWCLNKSSVTFQAFNTRDQFVVSVLGRNGSDVSKRFATFGSHRVPEGVKVTPTSMGPPTFPGALAVFECEVEARYEAGDHVIIVGRVVSFRHAPDSTEPLVFFRGRYGTIKD
ncbi:MAG: flavin reductase family protein [Alphaproteobacteria bacterium]